MLYEHIYRAMRFLAQQTLSPNEVCSVAVSLLYQNGIMPEDFVLDAHSLPAIARLNS